MLYHSTYHFCKFVNIFFIISRALQLFLVCRDGVTISTTFKLNESESLVDLLLTVLKFTRGQKKYEPIANSAEQLDCLRNGFIAFEKKFNENKYILVRHILVQHCLSVRNS